MSKLSIKVFKDNKLGGMLDKVFWSSPYVAINSAYPDEYKPWHLPHTPVKYWNEQTAREAIIWLVEKELCIDESEILDTLTFEVFCKYKFDGMLNNLFNGDIPVAIYNAYPNINNVA